MKNKYLQGNFWYQEDTQDVGLAMIQRYNLLHVNYNRMYRDYTRFIAIYLGLDARFGLANLRRYRDYRVNVQGHENVTASCIETLLSKMSKMKPEPKYLSSGGNWKKQQECKKLNKFTIGAFAGANVYPLAIECLRSALLTGTGILKTFAEDNSVKSEQIYPWELVVEEPEGAIDYTIDTATLARSVSKSKLMQTFPKFAAEIASSTDQTDHWNKENRLVATLDEVTVYEGHHVDLKGEGRHVIAIGDGTTLLDEKWEGDLPYSFIKYDKIPTHFWGMGLVEKLRPLQTHLDHCNAHINWALKWEIPWLLINRQAEIIKNQMGNLGMAMIKYNFQPPQLVNLTALNQVWLVERDRTGRKMFEIAGISQLSATSQTPTTAAESGVALQTRLDVESDRFNTLGEEYKNFFTDIARKMRQAAKQVADSGETLTVKVNDKDFFSTIDWNDIDLEDEDYTVKCFAVNSLPTSPEGRLQRVIDMNNAGLLEEGEARKLLDYEDLEREEDMDEALRESIRMSVDNMICDGIYSGPEEEDDVNYGLKYALKALHRAKIEKAPEDRKELLRDYIADCSELIKASQPPAPIDPTGEQPPIPGGGVPPPQGPQQ